MANVQLLLALLCVCFVSALARSAQGSDGPHLLRGASVQKHGSERSLEGREFNMDARLNSAEPGRVAELKLQSSSFEEFKQNAGQFNSTKYVSRTVWLYRVTFIMTTHILNHFLEQAYDMTLIGREDGSYLFQNNLQGGLPSGVAAAVVDYVCTTMRDPATGFPSHIELIHTFEAFGRTMVSFISLAVPGWGLNRIPQVALEGLIHTGVFVATRGVTGPVTDYCRSAPLRNDADRCAFFGINIRRIGFTPAPPAQG